ncbi:MAG: hypothetical protein L0312_33670, partial [Acidobacteria bacterium]|nr:hypothetical protein [Acidobacteriota bacterium]
PAHKAGRALKLAVSSSHARPRCSPRSQGGARIETQSIPMFDDALNGSPRSQGGARIETQAQWLEATATLFGPVSSNLGRMLYRLQ